MHIGFYPIIFDYCCLIHKVIVMFWYCAPVSAANFNSRFCKSINSISFYSVFVDGRSCVLCRYFKVLIQEMDLKLDLGFLYAILDLFTPENANIVTSEQEV